MDIQNLFKKTKKYWDENKEDLISKTQTVANDAKNIANETKKTIEQYWDENKDDVEKKAKEISDKGSNVVKTTIQSTHETGKNIYRGIRYSDADISNLQTNIENQGGMYRERLRILRENSTVKDSIMLGGETLVALLAATNIPDEIIRAYEAAYPNLSLNITFADKVNELDDEALIGFISGVKGKLFEMKYVDYLNDGNLPEEYTAFLAQSATQPGWDIGIEGPHGELASVIQAKATDSVSYVTESIEKYPNIDFVTTEEVYGHLVMSGISDNIANGQISNEELINALEDSVDATDISIDFTPPILTLAFIAFTSYNEKNLTLFERAKKAGDRAGKTYLSYLVGNGLAVVTNTWWLGVIGSIGSRLISDQGERKFEVYKKLEQIQSTNQKILDQMKSKSQTQSLSLPG